LAYVFEYKTFFDWGKHRTRNEASMQRMRRQAESFIRFHLINEGSLSFKRALVCVQTSPRLKNAEGSPI